MAHHLHAPTIIAKKRDGQHLTEEEMQFFIQGVTNGDFGDSQIGAMLMAMYLNSMSMQEATVMTKFMMDSGDVCQWPAEWRGRVVDKHSTGGVGDKTSLLLAPALAACNLKVPMVSGRGLGFTGGTLDKLEAVPGFKIQQSTADITRCLADVGCCIVGQTDRLCPADKKLYAVRDVTSTVGKMELITASIVCKKAAENLDALVLDVKTGRGAFMARREDAVNLAQQMVTVGDGLGMHTAALITDMDHPLGRHVGNALEVLESILGLQGHGPPDLMELVVNLGAQVLLHTPTPMAATVEEARAIIESKISDGSALAKFKAMLQAQGVREEDAEKLCAPGADVWQVMARAPHTTELKAAKSGYVTDLDSMACAETVRKLGGGRTKEGDAIDYRVGLELLKTVGDHVTAGESWVRVYHATPTLHAQLVTLMEGAVTLADSAPQPRSRVLQVLDSPLVSNGNGQA